MRRGHYKEALKHLADLDPIWPNSIFVWRTQGICYLGLGEYPKAQELLSRVLISTPQDQEALLKLGQSYLRQGDLEQARHSFSRLLLLNPKENQAQYDLGVTLGKMGRTAEASLYLGLAFKERGNRRTALYHLKRAVDGLKGKPELQKKAQAALDELTESGQKKRPDKNAKERRER